MIKELDSLPQNFVLMQVNSGMNNNLDFSLIKNFTNKKGFSGTYVVLKKRFSNLQKNIKRYNIRKNKLNFVSSCNLGFKDSTIIDSPSNLVALCFALDKALNDEDAHFLVLDSINDMLEHNSFEMVMAFLFFLVGKVKLLNKKAIVFAINTKKKSHDIAALSQIFDKVITVV